MRQHARIERCVEPLPQASAFVANGMNLFLKRGNNGSQLFHEFGAPLKELGLELRSPHLISISGMALRSGSVRSVRSGRAKTLQQMRNFGLPGDTIQGIVPMRSHKRQGLGDIILGRRTFR